MDYIREELLRQQVLLTALLTGSVPLSRKVPEDGEVQDTQMFVSQWEDAAGKAAAAGEESSVQAAVQAEALWAALAAGPAGAQRRSWDPGTGGGRGGSLQDVARFPTTGTRAAGSSAAMAVTPSNTRRSAGADEPAAYAAAGGAPSQSEGAQIRLVTELRQGEATTSPDAAALSLAFQRDARRYDGGFRLY